MQVGDILRKKTARVATVRMNETVGIAAQLMRASNISALVVKDVVRTEGNTAVGMFTERDVVRAIAEHGAAGVSLKVSQLISVQQLVSCSSTDTLEHVRHLMNKHHIRHLPVIDNYSLIGVVSIRDISTAFDDEATASARSLSARAESPLTHNLAFDMPKPADCRWRSLSVDQGLLEGELNPCPFA
jgi:CBS domain-containing protein